MTFTSGMQYTNLSEFLHRTRLSVSPSASLSMCPYAAGTGGALKREREPRAAGARTRSPGRRMSSGVGETLNVLNGDVANVRETVNDAAAKSRLRYFDGFTWRTGH